MIDEATPLSRRAAAAADRWLAAAGPWRRWSLVVPLVGIGADLLARQVGEGPAKRVGEQVRQRREDEVAQRVGATLSDAQRAWVLAKVHAAVHEPCLVLLDLAPVLGAAVAATLHHDGQAHPVPLLGRWPVAPAVLPAQPLVDALIAYAPRPRQSRLPSAIVVLDGERGQVLRGRSPNDPRTDNRYELDLDDLPDTNTLHALGVRRVHAVVTGRRSTGPGARTALPRYAAARFGVSHDVVPW
jgi:hypothetical protein